jgi:hypothetical protein
MYYEDIIKAIDNAPVTFLIGIFNNTVKNIYKRKVFKDVPTCRHILKNAVDRIIDNDGEIPFKEK